MNIPSAKRLLVAAAMGLLLSACASTPDNNEAPTPAATHYWQSEVSTQTYNRDNTVCQRTTDSTSSGELDPNSLSFQAYRDCMIEKGYTLRTY